MRGYVGKVETEAPASRRTPSEDCYSLRTLQAHPSSTLLRLVLIVGAAHR